MAAREFVQIHSDVTKWLDLEICMQLTFLKDSDYDTYGLICYITITSHRLIILLYQ